MTRGWCFDIYLRYPATNNRTMMRFFVDVFYDTGTVFLDTVYVFELLILEPPLPNKFDEIS